MYGNQAESEVNNATRASAETSPPRQYSKQFSKSHNKLSTETLTVRTSKRAQSMGSRLCQVEAHGCQTPDLSVRTYHSET